MTDSREPTKTLVSVFPAGPRGGNPCTLVTGPSTAGDMLALAKRVGHECCLVSTDPATSAVSLRFFSPGGEMEMCGHATIAAAWLVGVGKQPRTLCTVSGMVEAHASETGTIWISQPPGEVSEVIAPTVALSSLGLTQDDLSPGSSLLQAGTSRTKTLIEVKSAIVLGSIRPDTRAIVKACEGLNSTGLYVWCAGHRNHVHTRQLPKDAGYLEDAATGIAASALFYALGEPGVGLTVHQGYAMGRPSEILVKRNDRASGCLIGGKVVLIEESEPA